jgi:hypothetical protein
MFQPTFFTPLDIKSLNILLECLTLLDQHYLYENPHTPSLYTSGVRYQMEPQGVEEWLTIPELLSRKVGDCEDLACWLAAEYRIKGYNAVAFAARVPNRGPKPLYHVRVRLHNGREIEDPSRALGMPAPDGAR